MRCVRNTQLFREFFLSLGGQLPSRRGAGSQRQEAVLSQPPFLLFSRFFFGGLEACPRPCLEPCAAAVTVAAQGSEAYSHRLGSQPPKRTFFVFLIPAQKRLILLGLRSIPTLFYFGPVGRLRQFRHRAPLDCLESGGASGGNRAVRVELEARGEVPGGQLRVRSTHE